MAHFPSLHQADIWPRPVYVWEGALVSGDKGAPRPETRTLRGAAGRGAGTIWGLKHLWGSDLGELVGTPPRRGSVGSTPSV